MKKNKICLWPNSLLWTLFIDGFPTFRWARPPRRSSASRSTRPTSSTSPGGSSTEPSNRYLVLKDDLLGKVDWCSLLLTEQLIYNYWIWANFLVAPAPDFFFKAAPAPDFFPTRLRLLVFFFERLRLQGAKKTGSGSWLLVKFGKIFFSPQTSKVKLQKI